jgi:hypothetical protein
MGRSDLVIEHRGVTWVLEIKVARDGNDPENKATEALKQINDKNYAGQYADTVCIGIAIDDATRQIEKWKTVE